PLQRKLMKFIRPAAKMVTDMPLPEEETYDALEELFKEVYELYYTLQNAEISSIRLVTNPEKMVLKETEKAYTYLHLFGFHVDAIFVNRVYSKKKEVSQLQEKYLELIKEAFEPTPIILIPHMEEEILGLEKLKLFGKNIFKDFDPSKILYYDKPFEIIEKNGKYVLKIFSKNLPKETPEIYHRGEDLFLKLRNFKRYFYLPKSLSKREIEKAVVTDEGLELYFI
ncbi:MAG: ArsA family ATPase, partial [Caldimicrobium sp.]